MAAPDNVVPDPARDAVGVAPPAAPSISPAIAAPSASMMAPAAVAPPAPIVAPAVVSRFGEISPAFAARIGASIDAGLALGSRNAAARELAASLRRPRGSSRAAALPREIATPQALPRSRVSAALISGPSDSPVR
jgi:hypothetical protein